MGRSKHWGESLTRIDPHYSQIIAGPTHLLQLPSTRPHWQIKKLQTGDPKLDSIRDISSPTIRGESLTQTVEGHSYIRERQAESDLCNKPKPLCAPQKTTPPQGGRNNPTCPPATKATTDTHKSDKARKQKATLSL
jgi:hypothetical protein